MRKWIVFLLLIPYLNCQSQITTLIVDLERVPQTKIKILISDHSNEKLRTECIIPGPTFRKGQNLNGYRQLESEYLLHEKPDVVWKSYKTTNPAESWNGSMVSFGLLISKPEKSIFYNDDVTYCGIDTGQVFYINLRILKGLYNLAVGLEIVDIDPLLKTITYSYIQGGKSRGKQTINFLPARNGKTRIVHETAFKGDSFIRDRYLYPFFHRMAINEFHRNMRKAIYRQTSES